MDQADEGSGQDLTMGSEEPGGCSGPESEGQGEGEIKREVQDPVPELRGWPAQLLSLW